jgi:hypothetical protein
MKGFRQKLRERGLKANRATARYAAKPTQSQLGVAYAKRSAFVNNCKLRPPMWTFRACTRLSLVDMSKPAAARQPGRNSLPASPSSRRAFNQGPLLRATNRPRDSPENYPRLFLQCGQDGGSADENGFEDLQELWANGVLAKRGRRRAIGRHQTTGFQGRPIATIMA